MKKDLIIPLLLLVAVTLGCSTIRDPATKGNGPASSNSNSTSNGGDSPKGTTTASGDPREDVVVAAKKFLDLPAFSAKMDGTGINELHMQVAYIAPDRFHIIHSGGPAAGMEIIMIGKQTYMKVGGKWQKFPAALGTSIPDLREAFDEEGLKTLTDVKFEGDDTAEGKPALLYSYRNTTPKEHYPFTSKIWVRKDNGLPAKVSVDYASGVMKQMTIVYDTDTPVKIEPPVQ